MSQESDRKPGNIWQETLSELCAHETNAIRLKIRGLFPGILFPDELLDACVEPYKLATKIGLDPKKFLQEEIDAFLAAQPSSFSNVGYPIPGCNFGYTYGSHPNASDEQLEARGSSSSSSTSSRTVLAKSEKSAAPDEKKQKPAGEKSLDSKESSDKISSRGDFAFDESSKLYVHQEDSNELKKLNNAINYLKSKEKLSADQSAALQRNETFKKDVENKIAAYQTHTFKGYEDERFQKHDEEIMKLVREFNNDIKTGIGGTDEQVKSLLEAEDGGYLSADLIKAYMLKESAGTADMKNGQWDYDPMTVNRYGGDWSEEKKALGLEKPNGKHAVADYEKNLRAAIKYLTRKGFGKSGAPTEKNPYNKFGGWEKAIRNYGPPNNPKDEENTHKGDDHFNRIKEIQKSAIH